MKISYKQCQKVFKYGYLKKTESPKFDDLSSEEFHFLKEMLKQMPENSVRHLNYNKMKEDCKKISPEDVAEKLLIKNLVDKLLKER